MLFYTETISPRLKYITGFAAGEMGMDDWKLTTDISEFLDHSGPRISYTRERLLHEACWIRPHGLLFETGTRPQTTTCFTYRDTSAFFNTGGDFTFDIFAASFYLLSRYEEYLPHTKDIYGRYAHENSLAWKEGFLDAPIVNRWFQCLAGELLARYPALVARQKKFTYIPTYDIDEAFCYKHKSWFRQWGGAIKNIAKGQWKELRLRNLVAKGKLQDPFDSFEKMHELNKAYAPDPVYFFLVAGKTGRYDRHIPPSHPAMKTLIRDHASRYRIGIHPSWQSADDPDLFANEKRTLEEIAGIKLTASRQHFIRFTLPETYRKIAASGIIEEYSMGYGSVNGFRAGVATPFYWYDIEQEQETQLQVYPFCFMEANSFYEQKQTPAAALNEMRHYYKEVKKVNGVLVTIWHNTFLGSAEKFRGWEEVYRTFLQELEAG